MNREVWIFLMSVLCGGVVMLIFDLFRAVRRALKTGNVITAVSDVVFCLIAMFCSVACVWNVNNGIFRIYELVGSILGGIFYFLLLSRWIFKIFLFLIENILKFVRLIFKILLTPPRFLYKILVVPILKNIRNKRRKGQGTHDRRIQE